MACGCLQIKDHAGTIVRYTIGTRITDSTVRRKLSLIYAQFGSFWMMKECQAIVSTMCTPIGWFTEESMLLPVVLPVWDSEKAEA